MKMRIKDFTVIPLLCPLGMTDCSPCQYASNMRVVNPPATGIAPADFGSVDCNFIETFTKNLELAERNR